MNNRNIALDLLKIVLAIFVVALHCNLFIDHSRSLYFLTVEGMFRIFVPIFFIINGYYFKFTIEKEVLVLWIKRALILYVLWMVIYSSFWFNISHIKKSLLWAFIGYLHLWYLSAMVLSGITLYILKKVPKSILFIGLTLLFVTGCTIQYFGNYHVFQNVRLDTICNNIIFYRSFMFIGLPFFLLGYLINVYGVNNLLSNNTIFVACVFSLLLLMGESYLNYKNTGESIDCLFSLIIVCPFLFIYFLNLNIKLKINSQYIAILSTAIYLIHPLIIDFVHKLFPTSTNIEGFALIVLFSFMSSLLLILINKKVKYLL